MGVSRSSKSSGKWVPNPGGRPVGPQYTPLPKGTQNYSVPGDASEQIRKRREARKQKKNG